MLCQTRIVLGDEYPVMGYLTEQRQMRHEAYTLTARLVLGISQELPSTQRWPETGFFHPYIWLQPAQGRKKPGFLGGSAPTTEE